MCASRCRALVRQGPRSSNCCSTPERKTWSSATSTALSTRGGGLDATCGGSPSTNPDGYAGDLAGAVRGADVFIGVSAPNLLSGEEIAEMNEDAIIFALANPEPEVDPEIAALHAAVVATGRSDYPNQINNVLVFPGFFRGLLDAQSHRVTPDMMLAAASALAAVVTEDELSPHYIIPSVFHPGLAQRVAEAVREVALREGGVERHEN